MKQLLLVISFIVIFCMKISGQIIHTQVKCFEEISRELLSHIGKMGIDSSSILNEYEGRYLNYVFKTNLQDFDLVGKKVYFSFYRSKTDYFADEKKRFFRNSTTISATLYIFNTTQKAESGGYDAAIVSWRKRFVPIEEVVKWLKK